MAASGLFAVLAACGGTSPDPAAGAGRKLFDDHCSACHSYDGQAMGDAPPLEKAVFVTGPEGRLVRIILSGLRGPIDAQGRRYDQEMPGFGSVLSDQQVAALATFVRRRFAGVERRVQPETVARLRDPDRTSYWSVSELLALP